MWNWCMKGLIKASVNVWSLNLLVDCMETQDCTSSLFLKHCDCLNRSLMNGQQKWEGSRNKDRSTCFAEHNAKLVCGQKDYEWINQMNLLTVEFYFLSGKLCRLLLWISLMENEYSWIVYQYSYRWVLCNVMKSNIKDFLFFGVHGHLPFHWDIMMNSFRSHINC